MYAHPRQDGLSPLRVCVCDCVCVCVWSNPTSPRPDDRAGRLIWSTLLRVIAAAPTGARHGLSEADQNKYPVKSSGQWRHGLNQRGSRHGPANRRLSEASFGLTT